MKMYEDSTGRIIKVGDELEIIATNMYSGLVNEIGGKLHLQTSFFNHLLSDHLEATDLQEVYVVNPSVQ